MSKYEEYVKVERERISELIANIDNLWVLEQICRCVINVAKDGDKA